MPRAPVVGDLPPRSTAVRKYDWDRIVKDLRRTATKDPESWTKVLVEVPVTLAVAIRGRRMSALRTDDGVVEVRVRNSVRVNGSRRGDLWMRFVPKESD